MITDEQHAWLQKTLKINVKHQDVAPNGEDFLRRERGKAYEGEEKEVGFRAHLKKATTPLEQALQDRAAKGTSTVTRMYGAPEIAAKTVKVTEDGKITTEADGTVEGKRIYSVDANSGDMVLGDGNEFRLVEVATGIIETRITDYDTAVKFAANSGGKYRIENPHHSSMVRGGAVRGAGIIDVKRGEITEISNSSGHYKPRFEHLLQVVEALIANGALLSHDVVDAEGRDVKAEMPKAYELYSRLQPKIAELTAERARIVDKLSKELLTDTVSEKESQTLDTEIARMERGFDLVSKGIAALRKMGIGESNRLKDAKVNLNYASADLNGLEFRMSAETDTMPLADFVGGQGSRKPKKLTPEPLNTLTDHEPDPLRDDETAEMDLPSTPEDNPAESETSVRQEDSPNISDDDAVEGDTNPLRGDGGTNTVKGYLPDPPDYPLQEDGGGSPVQRYLPDPPDSPLRGEADGNPVQGYLPDPPDNPLRGDADGNPVQGYLPDPPNDPLREDGSGNPVQGYLPDPPDSPLRGDADGNPVQGYLPDPPDNPLRGEADGNPVQGYLPDPPDNPLRGEADGNPVQGYLPDPQDNPLRGDADGNPVQGYLPDPPNDPLREDGSGNPVQGYLPDPPDSPLRGDTDGNPVQGYLPDPPDDPLRGDGGTNTENGYLRDDFEESGGFDSSKPSPEPLGYTFKDGVKTFSDGHQEVEVKTEKEPEPETVAVERPVKKRSAMDALETQEKNRVKASRQAGAKNKMLDELNALAEKGDETGLHAMGDRNPRPMDTPDQGDDLVDDVKGTVNDEGEEVEASLLKSRDEEEKFLEERRKERLEDVRKSGANIRKGLRPEDREGTKDGIIAEGQAPEVDRKEWEREIDKINKGLDDLES
jgi:hypothetical protein